MSLFAASIKGRKHTSESTALMSKTSSKPGKETWKTTHSHTPVFSLRHGHITFCIPTNTAVPQKTKCQPLLAKCFYCTSGDRMAMGIIRQRNLIRRNPFCLPL